MNYSVFLNSQVIKFLKKIPKTDVERIKAKLAELSDPYSVRAVKLKGSYAFRVRIGDYRILYTVDDSKKVVIIFKIDKRSRVYNR